MKKLFAGALLLAAATAASAQHSIPTPPNDLRIGRVAMNFSQDKTTVAGNWTAPAGDVTTWYLMFGTVNLGGGTVFSPTGNYSMLWSGKKLKSAPVLTVCDGLLCQSKTAS